MTLDRGAYDAGKTNKCSQGMMSAVLAALSFNLVAPVLASDFDHAQKVYVPPSNVDRRIDISSIREQYTVPGKKAPAKAGSSAGKPGTKTAAHHTPVKTAAKPGASTASKSGFGAYKALTPKTATPVKTAAGKSMVKTIVASPKGPAPSITGQVPSAKSISDVAKSLGSKIPPSVVAKMKQTAADLQKSGKLEEAQKVLTKLGQLTPEDKANLSQLASIGVLRAKVYMKSNNFQGALLQARTALSANPNNAEASQILGQLYRKVGADPNDVNSRLKTANTLYQQSRYAEAEVEFKASLAIKPTPEAHVGIGRVFEKLNGAGAGKKHFEHALELDSNSAAAHRELGLIHLQSGDVVSANSELSRALILDSTDKEAGSSLTKLWQSQVSKMPNANSHLGLARSYQLNGDLQSAQAEYREVVRIDPNHPYLPAARQSFKIALAKQEAEKSIAAARNLESQGLISDAYQKANEAVAYSPGNSDYKIYQGELLEKLGQPVMAKQVYLNILKDDPQNQAAVQRIKALAAVSVPSMYPGIAGAGLAATGMSAAGMQQSLLPGGSNTNIYRQPTGFPGTKFPFDASSGATALGVGAAGAVAPVDQVGTLGSFMGALRNHMLGAKTTNQKAEDAASAVLKQMTDPTSGAAGGAAGGGGAGGGLPSDISSLLGGGSAAASSSASAASLGTGADAALAGAAAALAAINGGGSAAARSSATPAAAASAAPTQSFLPYGSAAAGSIPAAAPNFNQGFGNPGGASAAGSSPGTYAGTAGGAMAPVYSQPVYSQPVYSQPVGTSVMPSMPAPAPSINATTPGQLPYGLNQLSAPIAPVSDTNSELRSALPSASSPAADSGLRGPIAGNQPIKFELQQIKPTLKDVQLKVTLRNESNSAVQIPDNLQAVIKYTNLTESNLKVSFDDKSIAPHGVVEGVVRVPFDKVDPSADLVLRNMLPASGQELHIIKTAISQK